MYVKGKVLIHRFKKPKNLDFHKNGLRPHTSIKFADNLKSEFKTTLLKHPAVTSIK